MSFSDLDPSVVESLLKDLNSINVWLQNIADIPPETKLTKDGTGFTLYPDTFRAWFIRTFWTNDSGNSHTTEFKSGYEKVELKIRECMNLPVRIDVDYYQNIARLLVLSKKGLSNFMNHHDYRQNTYITGNIQNLINFVIPKQVKMIKDYLQMDQSKPQMRSAPMSIPTPRVNNNTNTNNNNNTVPYLAPMFNFPTQFLNNVNTIANNNNNNNSNNHTPPNSLNLPLPNTISATSPPITSNSPSCTETSYDHDEFES